MNRFYRAAVTGLTCLSLLAPAAPSLAAPADSPVAVAVLRAGPQGLRVERHVAGSAGDAAALLRTLRARPDVVVADVDVPTRAEGTDPLRARQWGLDRLQAETAWQTADASGQVVAVLDPGVDGTHPDLGGALVPGYDVFDADGDGATDGNGHGTHAAGIAGALVGNDVGVAGLGRAALIMPVRVLDDSGSGNTSGLAEGIIWAVDHGADVLSMSLSATESTTVLDAAIAYALDHGVVPVAAAGNRYATGSPPAYPAAIPGVIGVGATDEDDTHADFSSAGEWVDVAAPGVGIYSTLPSSNYGWYSGTSMATPFVAAAAALLRSAWPALDPQQVADRLTATAEDLGEPGVDPLFGHGLIDPVAALAEAPAAPEPVEEPTAEPSPEPTPSDEPAPEPTPSDEPAPEPSDEPAGDSITRVGDSPDPARAAVEISQASFAQAGSADTALLARDDAFADSLAGSALAGDRGPILYTTGGPDAPLRPETAAELQRVLAPGATVTVLGGTAAVSDAAFAQVRALGFPVRRLSGPSRVETALAVAEAVDSHPGRVLLANGWNWADAVTGGAYAAAEGIPVLVTAASRLDDSVAAYLAAHRPQVVLLGGRVALGDEVAQRVGPGATRIAGATRVGTAVAISRDLWGRRDAAPGDAWVIEDGYGPDSWAPALAAATLSAGSNAPQLLVDGANLPAETRDYLAELGYDEDLSGTAVLVGARVGADIGDALEGPLTGLLGG